MIRTGTARVVVALGTAGPDVAALEAAARLAAAVQADLAALFVEDVNLLRLAALPGALEFGFGSAAPRQIEAASIERALRVRAAALRRRLGAMAGQHAVSWTFEIARGHLPRVVLESAGDIVVLAAPQHRYPGMVARRAGERPRVAALLRDAEESRRVLATAEALAGETGEIVVLRAGTGAAPEPAAARRRSVAVADWDALAAALARERVTALVTAAPATAAELEQLAQAARAPVVLVR